MVKTLTIERIEPVAVAALTVHPAADDVPRMDADEWTAFLADVSARGIMEPLVITPKNVVLDGRHRLEAAGFAGLEEVPCRVVDLDAAAQVAYVLRSALLRRHLDESQRAMLAARLKPKAQEAAKERQREHGGTAPGKKNTPGKIAPSVPNGRARDVVAQAANVSGRTVDHAEKVLKHGAPELVKAVDKGEVPVSTAAKLAALPKDTQRSAVAGGIKGVRDAVHAANPVAISDTLFNSVRDLVGKVEGIREQYGTVAEMFGSKLWKGCDTTFVIEIVHEAHILFRDLDTEMTEYANAKA